MDIRHRLRLGKRNWQREVLVLIVVAAGWDMGESSLSWILGVGIRVFADGYQSKGVAGIAFRKHLSRWELHRPIFGQYRFVKKGLGWKRDGEDSSRYTVAQFYYHVNSYLMSTIIMDKKRSTFEQNLRKS